MTTITKTIAILCALLLGACGGGDDEGPQRTEVAGVSVSADSYSFPLQTGIQDRVFDTATFTNTGGASVTIEVSVSGSRTVAAAAGMVGTASFRSFVAVVNVTDSLLVGSSQDSMPSQVAGLAAGQSTTFTESNTFTVEVPPGKTFAFTPYGRLTSLGIGTTGFHRLDTSGFKVSIRR